MKLPHDTIDQIFERKTVPVPIGYLDHAHCCCDNEQVKMYQFYSLTLKTFYFLNCEACGRNTSLYTNIDEMFQDWAAMIEKIMIGSPHMEFR